MYKIILGYSARIWLTFNIPRDLSSFQNGVYYSSCKVACGSNIWNLQEIGDLFFMQIMILKGNIIKSKTAEDYITVKTE